MKITKEQLKQVIQEELEEIVRGGEEYQRELERGKKSPEAQKAYGQLYNAAEEIRAAHEDGDSNEVFKLSEEIKNAAMALYGLAR